MSNHTGRTVNYTGDIANAPRTGFIAEIERDRWGTHAVIVWDESESIGWYEGEACTVTNPTTRVSLRQIVEATDARPGDRFRFA